MTAYLLTNHLLSFLAPAATMALLVVTISRIFSRFLTSNPLLVKPLSVRVAILFVVNVGVLVAGLVVFNNDAKMATYAAMVLASALCQWVLHRGWRV